MIVKERVNAAFVIPVLEEAVLEANSFTSNLKYIRSKLGVSQGQFSRMIGLKSPRIISYWESGEHDPDIKNFCLINLWAKWLKERESPYKLR